MPNTDHTLLFPWRPEYSIRIPEIDGQHQILIRLINDLQEAMYEGRGKAVLADILDDLVLYTESHFAFEEGMLEERGYSKLAAHHEEHQRLTQQVREIRDKVRYSGVTMTMEVMRFLKNWLAGHIMAHDQAYARELEGRTASSRP